MRQARRLLALLVPTIALAACTGSSSSDGPGDTEPANVSGMTEAHNAARAAVKPAANPPIPPLSWSSNVAGAAQAWANNCQFMHSGSQYGENIFAVAGTDTPAAVVGSWVASAADYDYATNSCSTFCGQYTQVVWRDTVRLGCGMAMCTQNSPFNGGAWQMWVCNYDPRGNIGGVKPY